MQPDNSIESLPLATDGLHAAIDKARESLNGIILGKDREVSLALACLLGRGHLLIEDLPGLGKTILAQSLAKVLGLSYQRIQFTSDLLPADIIGVSIFKQASGEFEFQPGPVFTQLVLADEINRATPKRRAHYSRRWKNDKYRQMARPTNCPNLISSWQRKIHPTRLAHSRYPNHNWIDS